MEKRKKVGVYALVALGLILAMGFAPMERGMAENSGSVSTDVMEEITIESYEGALFIIISGIDLGNFDGIIALVMDDITIEDIEDMMELLGLSEYLPYVMDDITIESLPGTVILVLEDEDIAYMEDGDIVPLVMDDITIEGGGIIFTPLVMDDITIESLPDLEPLVMDDITIE